MAKLGFTQTGFFLLAALFLCNLTNAKQLIRLRSGLECPESGYFRDAENCQKFYYCPSPSSMKAQDEAPLTIEELEIMRELTRRGMECPEGTIFDEAASSCQNMFLINSIPPECKLPTKGHVEPKSGIVREIQNNEVI